MFVFEGNVGSGIVYYYAEEPNELINLIDTETEIEVQLDDGPRIKVKKGDVLWFGVEFKKD